MKKSDVERDGAGRRELLELQGAEIIPISS
jgi:hypothetical protein